MAFDEIYFMHLIFNRPSVLSAQKRVFKEEFGIPLGLWNGYGYRPHAMDYEALDRALGKLRDSLPHARFNIALRGAKRCATTTRAAAGDWARHSATALASG